jgi:hypothetical protein
MHRMQIAPDAKSQLECRNPSNAMFAAFACAALPAPATEESCAVRGIGAQAQLRSRRKGENAALLLCLSCKQLTLAFATVAIASLTCVFKRPRLQLNRSFLVRLVEVDVRREP